VDDAICLSKCKDDADKLIRDLETKGFILTDKGSLSAYIGIQVECLSRNQIAMTQPALIAQIID
jgi:hypothetical protein